MRTNIVKVTLGRLTTVSKKQLWKEDYGQKIQFIGVDLPYRYEVDFADSPTGQAITMIGDETGVLVPDELLQKEGNIYAYLYLHTGADDGETQYTVILPVEQRAERTDIEPTPVQQSIIEQTIVALNDAVEQTAQDVIDATAAKDAAETAQGLAESARDAAETAQGKAEDAQEGAETAQGKAEDAQEAAETAQGMSEDARDASQGYSEDSEAWAVGERDGTSVPSTDPTYNNNSKHYAELAEQSAATSGYMFFYIDERGHLIYQHTPNVDVDFYLNQGHLYVRATA